MRKFISAVNAFLADENGITAIEYGLLAAVIGVGLVATFDTLKTDIISVFTKISTALKAA
jgi:pilus assembly protein Flp/PilA